MSLSAGTRLGSFDILERIGAGGMGEVYRARDTRLNRSVAIKLIARHRVGDDQARERFEKEARAIASLSHPHICTLYDIGAAGGVEFLVMEYLEGETLAARLARQGVGIPLPLDEVLRIATELSDALAAAHRAGIVHRDLKPANVMLARTGSARQAAAQVKVLDFGLAKLGAAPRGTSTQTTEVAVPLTDAATFVGTLPYMAPEQLERHEADSRSDLFAFGAIVYEMASGRRAFRGDSQASLIAAILDRDPEPLASIQPMVPPGLDRLVRKCLAKDPDARWQSASDVTDELRWLSSGSGATGVATTEQPSHQWRRVWPWWAVAAVMMMIAAAATIWYRARSSQAPRPVEVTHRQVTFAGTVLNAALSPDGQTVAYATGQEGRAMQLLVRDVRGGRPLELWRGDDLWDLKWLSDGSHLVISGRQSGRLETWFVPRLGGAPRRLDTGGGYVAMSPDGSHVAVASQGSQGFSILPISGGAGRTVALAGFRALYGLDWSAPSNRLVIPTRTDEGESVVWTVRSDGQELRRMYADKGALRAVCWSPGGEALYLFTGQKLVRLPLTDAPPSTPETLMSGLPLSGRHCSVSADGRQILHVRTSAYSNVWLLDLGQRTPRATPVTFGTSGYNFPGLSPDGKWILMSGGEGGDVMKIPRAGGEPIPLVKGTSAAWSPDGRRLAFVSDRGGARQVWVSDADGGGSLEIKDAVVTNPLVTWLPDGRLAWQTPDARNYRIRNLVNGKDELLMKEPTVGWVFVPRFSPKGDTVAIFRNRQGDRGLWTLSWPDRLERLVAAKSIYPDGWSPDGEWIYGHEGNSATIVKVSVRNGTVEQVGTFPVGALGMDVCNLALDGHAFVCSLAETKADAWVIEHFDPRARPRAR
jgi:eukaryotic-like serine/threonine-protein kinase